MEKLEIQHPDIRTILNSSTEQQLLNKFDLIVNELDLKESDKAKYKDLLEKSFDQSSSLDIDYKKIKTLQAFLFAIRKAGILSMQDEVLCHFNEYIKTLCEEKKLDFNEIYDEDYLHRAIVGQSPREPYVSTIFLNIRDEFVRFIDKVIMSK